jgi:hypothetical protein
MMTTWIFNNPETGEELEVDAEGFDEACNIMFSGEHALNPNDWELTDSY